MKIGLLETGEPAERPANRVRRYGGDVPGTCWGPSTATRLRRPGRRAAQPIRPSATPMSITGSAAGVYDDLPWIAPLKAFPASRRQGREPLVGVCFGHQIMAEAFGGKASSPTRAGAWACTPTRSPRRNRGWTRREPGGRPGSHQDQVIACRPAPVCGGRQRLHALRRSWSTTTARRSRCSSTPSSRRPMPGPDRGAARHPLHRRAGRRARSPASAANDRTGWATGSGLSGPSARQPKAKLERSGAETGRARLMRVVYRRARRNPGWRPARSSPASRPRPKPRAGPAAAAEDRRQLPVDQGSGRPLGRPVHRGRQGDPEPALHELPPGPARPDPGR
jgi:GMP synthase-like glutamine amidotransferase